MNRWTTLLPLLPALALAQTEAPKGPQPKLTVVPFAALSGDVPPRAGLKAAGMLSTEFKSSDSVQLVEMKRDKVQDPFADSLANARKAVDDARAQRAKKKFRLADEALVRALAAYRFAAGGITDIGEVVDTWALLSAVQFNTGRDEDGQKSLVTALSLAPERELPLAATSVLFGRVVADTRKAVKDGPKGAMLVESTPAGASVFVDGVSLGATPLQVKDVPPGLHYWRLTLPSGEALGGAAEVSQGKVTRVTATSSTRDPESRLLSQLAQNRLDSEALGAAKDAAGAAAAELVVFGALSREGKGLALDAFLFTTQGQEIRRLPRTTFDTELLSAGMEFYNLAGALAQKGAKVGEPVRLPASVSPSIASGSARKVAEVRYGEKPRDDEPTELGPGEGGRDEGPKKPLEKRAPLRKK